MSTRTQDNKTVENFNRAYSCAYQRKELRQMTLCVVSKWNIFWRGALQLVGPGLEPRVPDHRPKANPKVIGSTPMAGNPPSRALACQ